MDDTLKQVLAVREGLGWFDRSAMGLLAISGADRYTWLQGMVSNDVRLLEKRAVTRLPACILDPTGHVIADLALIELPRGLFKDGTGHDAAVILIETPPGEAARIAAHLERYLIMEDAAVEDVSSRFVCASIQGPMVSAAQHVLDAAGNTVSVVEADHTGSGGVDLYFPAPSALQLSDRMRGLVSTEVGPAAQEILRIEAGIPKYGVDMNETTLAPEAGLMSTHISLTKGCYVGQEIVARIDTRGHTNRALTGFLVLGETLPAPGEKLFSDEVVGDGKEIGWITSVAPISPAAGGRPIALGYARHEHRSAGTWLRLGSAESSRRVEAAELPFYRKPVS